MHITIKKTEKYKKIFWFYKSLKETPDNWVEVYPVKIFGIFIGRVLVTRNKGFNKDLNHSLTFNLK